MGTVRQNRTAGLVQFPSQLPRANFTRCQKVYTFPIQGDFITLFCIYEKPAEKPVLLLMNSKNCAFSSIERERHVRRHNIEISSGPFSRELDLLERPVQAHSYNFSMCGTDVFDTLAHRNHCFLKYKNPLLWRRRFVNTFWCKMTVNSYIVYRSRNATYISSTRYRHFLFWSFASVTNDYFGIPHRSVKNERSRSPNQYCGLCPPFQGNFRPHRTKNKCQNCPVKVCSNHSIMVCEDCYVDVSLRCIFPMSLRTYESLRKKCSRKNCTVTRARTYCQRCLIPYCLDHLYTVCIICHPIQEG